MVAAALFGGHIWIHAGDDPGPRTRREDTDQVHRRGLERIGFAGGDRFTDLLRQALFELFFIWQHSDRKGRVRKYF